MGEWIETETVAVLPAAWTAARKLLADFNDNWGGGETESLDGTVEVNIGREANYGDNSEVLNLLESWGVPYRFSHEGRYEIPGAVVTFRDGSVADYRGDADGATVEAHRVVEAYDAGMQQLAALVDELRGSDWHPSAADIAHLMDRPDPTTHGCVECAWSGLHHYDDIGLDVVTVQRHDECEAFEGDLEAAQFVAYCHPKFRWIVYVTPGTEGLDGIDVVKIVDAHEELADDLPDIIEGGDVYLSTHDALPKLGMDLVHGTEATR